MKTKSLFSRIVCTTLITSFLSLSGAHSTHAEMVSTDAYLAQKQGSPRDRINLLLQKTEVQAKLLEYGLSIEEAQNRIASFSDSEIEKLNHQIDQLPAGADAAGAVLGTALAVFIILLITDVLCLTKVFKFTRCAGGK